MGPSLSEPWGPPCEVRAFVLPALLLSVRGAISFPGISLGKRSGSIFFLSWHGTWVSALLGNECLQKAWPCGEVAPYGAVPQCKRGPSQQPPASQANPVVKDALFWGQGPLKR